MSDLVERVHSLAKSLRANGAVRTPDLMDEAATALTAKDKELEALRERVKELEGMLSPESDHPTRNVGLLYQQARAETAERKLANLIAVIEAETNGDRATINEQNAFEHFTRLNKNLVAIRSAARAVIEKE